MKTTELAQLLQTVINDSYAQDCLQRRIYYSENQDERLGDARAYGASELASALVLLLSRKRSEKLSGADRMRVMAKHKRGSLAPDRAGQGREQTAAPSFQTGDQSLRSNNMSNADKQAQKAAELGRMNKATQALTLLEEAVKENRHGLLCPYAMHWSMYRPGRRGSRKMLLERWRSEAPACECWLGKAKALLGK